MTLSRRGFLRLGAATGGALALGFHLPGCAFLPGPSATAQSFAATGELRPNAWLRILPDDRILFALDRVEMGQGTMTSHAMLIAEELEVDPRRIEIEHAARLEGDLLPERGGQAKHHGALDLRAHEL
ncbi:MAG TPA: molybdopterin-dependent oxidoreductase, partial [Kofleriaceae bacterium]|nr:molybdopterin-dependent oxidoreductase [Kofleriaceae bacterium]